MNLKMKKFVYSVLLAGLTGFIVLCGALIAGLLSSGYTVVNAAMSAPHIVGNWAHIFTTAVMMGLFFCFIMSQLLLVHRVRHTVKR